VVGVWKLPAHDFSAGEVKKTNFIPGVHKKWWISAGKGKHFS
jgi:hypothetical protein